MTILSLYNLLSVYGKKTEKSNFRIILLILECIFFTKKSCRRNLIRSERNIKKKRFEIFECKIIIYERKLIGNAKNGNLLPKITRGKNFVS